MVHKEVTAIVCDRTSIDVLKKNDVSFKQIGKFGGEKIQFTDDSKLLIDLDLKKTHEIWLHALPNLVLHGKNPSDTNG